MSYRLLIRNANQVVLVCQNGERILRGDGMKEIALLEGGGLSVVVDGEGRIAAIGSDADVQAQLGEGVTFEKEIDAKGMCVLPGLVDAHTHPVWVGDRVHEFAMKLAGATYMDIHAKGGGIHYTVNCVRQASFNDLYSSLSKRLTAMMHCGTTLVEAKSGYGLDLDTERKMLQAIEKAKKNHPVSISSTFCGAHAIPKGSTVSEATHNIINVQIPALQELCAAGELSIDNIDVFCERGVFDTQASRSILKAGQEAGWKVNFHGDELHPMYSGELACELGAHAVSHLEEVSDAGIEALSSGGVVAVLLPTTAYILRLKPPPARKMIEKGVAVALGSDFNPNAYCMSMPMVMHLSCCLLGLSMPEALAAATINAAGALGMAEDHGSIEVGKWGDFIVLDAPRWEHIIYQFGCHEGIIKHVIKKGNVVHSNN